MIPNIHQVFRHLFAGMATLIGILLLIGDEGLNALIKNVPEAILAFSFLILSFGLGGAAGRLSTWTCTELFYWKNPKEEFAKKKQENFAVRFAIGKDKPALEFLKREFQIGKLDFDQLDYLHEYCKMYLREYGNSTTWAYLKYIEDGIVSAYKSLVPVFFVCWVAASTSTLDISVWPRIALGVAPLLWSIHCFKAYDNKIDEDYKILLAYYHCVSGRRTRSSPELDAPRSTEATIKP